MKRTALAALLVVSGRSAATAQTAPRTEEFIRKVAISDMFEIQSSEIAASKTTGPTREFDQTMIKDHQKTSGELKQLVSQGKVKATLPTALDDKHAQKLTTLQSTGNDRLAAQYQQDQVEAHTESVNLFQPYANGGGNADLNQWAAKTLPDLKHHLEMAQKISK